MQDQSRYSYRWEHRLEISARRELDVLERLFRAIEQAASSGPPSAQSRVVGEPGIMEFQASNAMQCSCQLRPLSVETRNSALGIHCPACDPAATTVASDAATALTVWKMPRPGCLALVPKAAPANWAGGYWLSAAALRGAWLRPRVRSAAAARAAIPITAITRGHVRRRRRPDGSARAGSQSSSAGCCHP